MIENELHLRTPKCVQDFSNRIAMLVWESLQGREDFPPPNAHRFPSMSEALNRILQRRVSVSSFLAPRPCQGHDQRLQAELKNDLDDLLQELEGETVAFLSRRDPAREAFHPTLREHVHHALQEAATPYLYENIACSSCEGDEVWEVAAYA